MKKSIFFLICLLFAGLNSSDAQRDIREILSTAQNFDATVSEAEAYFKAKHGDLTPKELCEGEHRDGDYVKFRRWQNFWADRLNPDGTLGDITAYHRSQRGVERGGGGPFDAIQWNNISYENFMTLQISLGRTTSLGFHPTDPNTFYVGAAIGGVWKTTDGGQTYTPLGDQLPFLAVSSIVVNQDNPDIIYIALSDHVWYGPPSIGVYKSTDAGLNWEPTNFSFEFAEEIRIYWMIADPSDPDRIFVAAQNGLYRTDDGFETFVMVNNQSSFDLKFQPGNPMVVYQGVNNGTFRRSTDGGENFEPIADLGNGSALIAVTPLNPDKVYVRSGDTVRKSTDAGLTFGAPDILPDNGSQLIFSPQDENTLYAGSFDVHRSVNNGNSFQQITHWLGDGGLQIIHVDQRNVFTNPLQPNLIYFCNDGGVYTVDVNTDEFEDLSNGLMITQFYDIAVSQTVPNVIGGGSQDNGNVFRNENGTWEEYAGTGDGMNQEIDPWNSNTRYWSYQVGGMRRWQGGNNVGIAPAGLDGQGAWETPYKLDYNIPDRMICGFDKIYESWDKGSSWVAISDNLAGGANMEQLSLAPSSMGRIYAVRGSTIYVKDLFSNEWESKSLPAGSVSDLEVDPIDKDIVYFTSAGYSEGNKVFRSMDAGDTWENISGSLPNVSTGAIETYTVVAGGLFVGTDAGVYYRDDTYDDWQLYGTIPHTRVEDIEIQYSGQLIRIGTHGRGVLEAPVTIGICSEGVDDEDEDGICDAYDACQDFDDSLLGTACNDDDPDTYEDVYVDCNVCEGVYWVGLDENAENIFSIYPNPTAGRFTIHFSLKVEGEILIHNAQGQLIKRQDVNGTAIDFDLTDQSSAVYSITIVTDKITTRRQLIAIEK